MKVKYLVWATWLLLTLAAANGRTINVSVGGVNYTFKNASLCTNNAQCAFMMDYDGVRVSLSLFAIRSIEWGQDIWLTTTFGRIRPFGDYKELVIEGEIPGGAIRSQLRLTRLQIASLRIE